jgi:hypothetical protein
VIVLDTGALVALDRGDRTMWSDLKAAGLAGVDVVVPAAVVAQAWRGSSRQARLSRALSGCDVASFDELAREIGVLCGASGTSDVVDASVALTVSDLRATRLFTSDPEDMRHLLRVLKCRSAKVIRC